MKKKYVLLLCVLLLLLLCGCASVNTDENDFTIGVSYDSNGAFPNQWISALKKVCGWEEVGIISVSAENDPTKQISDIERLITQQADVIVVRPTNTGAIVSALKSIKSAGIPCILIDFPIDSQYEGLYDVLLSEDADEQGRLQAEFVKEWINEDPSREMNIAYLSGPYEKQNSLPKRDSFYAELGITVPIVEADCGWSVTSALATTERWLETYPQINIFACMNDDMATGVIQALKTANKNLDDYLVLGMDGNLNYKDLIINGDIDCTIVRDLDKESLKLISIARGLADGVSYEKTIHPDSVFVLTKDNAAEYFASHSAPSEDYKYE